MFEAIIAGAGIIGSSIAWRLAQAGLRVALLDSGRMGGEASWAAAGMLAPGGEITGPSPWGSFALESLSRYPDFVTELELETGQRIDYQRLGAMEVAASEGDWRALGQRAEAQARLGISVCRMSREELLLEVPLANAGAAGAFFYPDDALVDPRDLMRALRAACVGRGVEILEGVRVIEMRPRPRSVEVVTAAGMFEGGWAVLAGGAWSSQVIIGGCPVPRTFPVRGHLMAFQLGAGSLGPILRCENTYLLQRAGGFTIAGTSSEQCGFDRALDRAILSDIQARASNLAPTLAVRTPDDAWLGFRPGVESDGPIIGAVDGSSLWLAYGHYRNGILMAPATAARVAGGIISSSEMDSCGPTGTI